MADNKPNLRTICYCSLCLGKKTLTVKTARGHLKKDKDVLNDLIGQSETPENQESIQDFRAYIQRTEFAILFERKPQNSQDLNGKRRRHRVPGDKTPATVVKPTSIEFEEGFDDNQADEPMDAEVQEPETVPPTVGHVCDDVNDIPLCDGNS